ncbi:MAG: TonB-dependent receptor [Bacteroidota bacterium]
MKTIRYALLLLLFVGGTSGLGAQNLYQTIRGTVVDVDTQLPLIGVNIQVLTVGDRLIGTTTDLDGRYRLEQVPLGRHSLAFSYTGYYPADVNNIVVSSGKEVILNLEMTETIVELSTAIVTARQEGEVNNEMATVSGRRFSVDETNRYAGSRGEPARMASNYAGVQGADDSRNDIVVRGNSPQGVLWRLEGINIPNPNHFAIPGTGGGPVTILNNKFLSDSDFFTGAFPAEYGNGTAGVFDLRMRNGNNEKHELSAQIGFLGTELMAEGPLSRKKGISYLATYRYSTLSLFSSLNINIGTDAIPQYQDGAFRISIPTKNNGYLALWGIGGSSQVDIVLSEDEVVDGDSDLFAANDRDQYFASQMGVLGMTYSQPLDSSSFLKTGLALSGNAVNTNHDFIYREVVDGRYRLDSITPILDYRFDETKLSGYVYVQRKLSRKSSIKFGLNADLYRFGFIDSVRIVRADARDSILLSPGWRTRWDARRSALLLQPYAHYKWKPTERLTLTAGLTSLWFSINDNSLSPLEPRLGAAYTLGKGQKLSLGLGVHSQIQSPYLYYYGAETIGGDPQEQNLDMGLNRSHHIVLGYDREFAHRMRLRVETYFQYLTNIPIDQSDGSYSLINSGAGFNRLFPDTLVNEGTARNYGVELTLEKSFAQGYYFLLTGSLFDAKYRGSDGVLRNVAFNGRFVLNGLVAREFTFEKGSTFNVGAKVTYAGGRWYGPVNEEASREQLDVVFRSETLNTLQFRPYFRTDLKLAYLWNRSRVTHEFAVDIVNIFNTRNILTLTYVPNHPSGEDVQEELQLGFLPLFYYKLDF